MEYVTVYIIDDSPVARMMLKNVVESKPGFKVVGDAETGSGGVIMMDEFTPDVLFLEDGVAGGESDVIIKDVRLVSPNTKIVLCHDQGRAGRRMEQNFIADDFLEKPCTVANVFRAIRNVLPQLS